ncbi:galactokinase [Bacillus pakistanensis]|uniref:Galactokinase n=2 Tax=Rossellomorea pakistanensis TaxID=992288 RepID=A0ABS2N7A6_9BACI|nr:galactokinase [Bacillus pakistanensis]MBM7583481.1 galactokinase [Bacillus pakistanensis]
MEKLKQKFKEKFGSEGEMKAFFAPGRVNLIGEHIDYNGGHVFPCALSIGTYAIARKRNDHKIMLFSQNFEDSGIVEVDLHNLTFNDTHEWANYPKGVIATFLQANYSLPVGLEIAFWGNIPNGAGLSSSASIELVTSIIIKELYQLNIEMIDIVKLSQKAENEYIGVNCGIMDQFTIGMGKKGHAILLNCHTFEHSYIPISLDKYTLVIANTNKRRGLSDSKYNERRNECKQALTALNKKVAVEALGDLTVAEFEKYKYLINDPIVKKRAKHAVYENNRTLKAVERLNQNDIESFGRLMNESHRSLRDDYEVSCMELDTLVELAWNEGAIGSRMTGAGFGGCTISIVDQKEIDVFIDSVSAAYYEQTGLIADFYVVEIGEGANRL